MRHAPLLSNMSFGLIGLSLVLSACGPVGDAPPAQSSSAQTQSISGVDDDDTPVSNPNVPETTPTTTAAAPTKDGNTIKTGFNLAVQGVNFTPHVGKNLYVGVVDANSTTPAATAVVAHAQIGNDGSASIDFTKVLQPNHTYSIAYFADTNSNGACDKGDHQYLDKLPSETADANTTVAHGSTMTSICGLLPTGTLP